MTTTKKIRVKPIIFVCFFIMTTAWFSSCKKFVEIAPPTNQLASNNVYRQDNTAAAVLSGIYVQINPDFVSGWNSVSFLSGLSADEFDLVTGAAPNSLNVVYANALSAGDGVPMWAEFYKYINTANTAIEGLNGSTTLTPAIKTHLLGEAKFIRAFLYFYLTNMYKDVPLALTSDYRINNVLPKSPSDKVYEQIISDLKDAEILLSDEYKKANITQSTDERVRPTRWAASALLARVYLYKKDYTNAEIEATKVIINNSLFELVKLDQAFVKNNHEAIWQIQPSTPGANSSDAEVFILNEQPGATYPAYLDSNLVKAFEPGDQRLKVWVNSADFNGITYYYPYKYKIVTSDLPEEYPGVLRLGEQYLIRAEARVNLGNLTDGKKDLDAIRARAGLLPVSITDQQGLLKAVMRERRVELFSEWGHRWFDLKRTETVNEVMAKVTPLKGGTWNANWQYYPIPIGDIRKNKNLIQNSGY
jgi:hypothetical protein